MKAIEADQQKNLSGKIRERDDQREQDQHHSCLVRETVYMPIIASSEQQQQKLYIVEETDFTELFQPSH